MLLVTLLYTLTTGSENCAFGGGALFLTTSATNNNAFGKNSLYYNTTGHNNIAIGSCVTSQHDRSL